MHTLAHRTIGLLLGVPCIVGSIELSGGHVATLFGPASALLVLTTAVGGFVAVRGVAATTRLLRAFGSTPSDPTLRHEVIADVDRLERTTLLGACLGALWGGAEAVGNLHTPGLVGPALALAIQSLLVGTWFCALVLQPWKHHLLPTGADDLLPARAAVGRALSCFGLVALVFAGTSGALPGAPQVMLTTIPVLLMLIGTMLPSLLAAPRAIVGGAASRPRSRWLSDSMLGAGVATIGCDVMHCFAVLDQPRLLAPGLAVAFAGFAVPFVFAGFLRLRASLADATPQEPAAARSPHPTFAAVAFVALAAMVAFVAALVQQLP